MVKSLLAQRRMPEQGWDEGTLRLLLQEIALMDSNTFVALPERTRGGGGGGLILSRGAPILREGTRPWGLGDLLGDARAQSAALTYPIEAHRCSSASQVAVDDTWSFGTTLARRSGRSPAGA